MLEQKYKKLLLQEYQSPLKKLSPEYEAKDNLDWLWSSVSQYGEADPKFQAALCQLALQFGRQVLSRADISHILNAPDTGNGDKLEAVIEVLQTE